MRGLWVFLMKLSDFKDNFDERVGKHNYQVWFLWVILFISVLVSVSSYISYSDRVERFKVWEQSVERGQSTKKPEHVNVELVEGILGEGEREALQSSTDSEALTVATKLVTVNSDKSRLEALKTINWYDRSVVGWLYQEGDGKMNYGLYTKAKSAKVMNWSKTYGSKFVKYRFIFETLSLDGVGNSKYKTETVEVEFYGNKVYSWTLS